MKLKPSYSTEVFISQGGYLAIKQQVYFRKESPVIVLTSEQAECVAREMRRLLENKADWWHIDADAPRPWPAVEAMPPTLAATKASP
jgi:hypothetical protein